MTGRIGWQKVSRFFFSFSVNLVQEACKKSLIFYRWRVDQDSSISRFSRENSIIKTRSSFLDLPVLAEILSSCSINSSGMRADTTEDDPLYLFGLITNLSTTFTSINSLMFTEKESNTINVYICNTNWYTLYTHSMVIEQIEERLV